MRTQANHLFALIVITIFLSSFYHESKASEWKNFQTRYGNHFAIRWSKKLGVPRLIYGKGIPVGNSIPVTQGNIGEFAKAFIGTNKHLFRVLMPDLKLKSIKHIRGNWSVKFQQYYSGIPVENGVIGLSITDDGLINLIGNGYYPGIKISTSPTISRYEAIAFSKKQYIEPGKAETKEAYIVILPVETPEGFEFRLAWKIDLLYHNNLLDSKVFFVDAVSGRILKERNTIAANGIGGTVKGHIWLTPPTYGIIPPSTQVFYPHLVVKLYGTQYQAVTDQNGFYNLPQGQLRVNLVYSTFENADIKLRVYQYAQPGHSIDEYLSLDPSWTWVDTTNHGGEYNVFYWLNFMHEYFLDNFNYDILGEEQLIVDMYGSGTGAWGSYMIFDDSPYRVRNKFAICHEYTHSIQGDLNIVYNYSNESGAFCEGSADYFSGSVLNDPTAGGDWRLDSIDSPNY